MYLFFTLPKKTMNMYSHVVSVFIAHITLYVTPFTFVFAIKGAHCTESHVFVETKTAIVAVIIKVRTWQRKKG